MITPLWSLPLPVPPHLPCPCLPHFVSSKVGFMYCSLTASTPFTNKLSKAPTLLLPHHMYVTTAGTVRDIVAWYNNATPHSRILHTRPSSFLYLLARCHCSPENAEPPTPWDPPNLPSPASSNQVLGILFTESHRQEFANGVPSAPPGPTSAPDLGAAAEGVGILICATTRTQLTPLVLTPRYTVKPPPPGHAVSISTPRDY
ncbi:hypothetical protein EDB87DRAFT_1637552 [Lactarius vividus]|nr:hypothetical protein EDB87DRAFT_1637552 [Lactarius vividus]